MVDQNLFVMGKRDLVFVTLKSDATPLLSPSCAGCHLIERFSDAQRALHGSSK
jgi:hypothetical protein